MKKLLLLSLLVLVLGLYNGCNLDGAGAGGAASGGAGGTDAPLLATVYVDGRVDATDGDGKSWDKAFKTLQAGINKASKITKRSNGYVRVHVAVGTYTPTSRPDGGDSGAPRTMHFALKNNVYVIGGYSGQGNERSTDPSKTILSGDLKGDDDPDDETTKKDNVYHVFYHPDSTNLDATAKLSNVTISGGNADAKSQPHNSGGGMYNGGMYNGGMYNKGVNSPTLNDIIFTSNRAGAGGGMYNSIASDPTLKDVIFTSNKGDAGGGMYNDLSSPTLDAVKFKDNEATEHGGGMYNRRSSPKISALISLSNTAKDGGGIYNNNSAPLLYDVDFKKNTAKEAGGAMYSDSKSEPNFISNPLTPTNDAEASKDNGYYKQPPAPPAP